MICNEIADLERTLTAPPRNTQVGCCFGAQILAKALGGVVDKNPTQRFVLGVESIAFRCERLRACGLYDALAEGLSQAIPDPSPEETLRAAGGEFGATPQAKASGPDQVLTRNIAADGSVLHLLESHGDQVVRLPQGAVLLGSSGEAPRA